MQLTFFALKKGLLTHLVMEMAGVPDRVQYVKVTEGMEALNFTQATQHTDTPTSCLERPVLRIPGFFSSSSSSSNFFLKQKQPYKNTL